MGGEAARGRRRAIAAAALACAGGLALSLHAAPGREGWFGAGLLLLAAAIAVIDLRHLIIPNELNLAVAALGLARAGLAAPDAPWAALGDAALRGLIFGAALLAVRQAYWLARRRHGLGLGDVKLAAAGGVWLHWASQPIAVEIAALSALAVYVLQARARHAPIDWTSRLPFGLFLAPAIWAAWLIEAWPG